MATSTQDSPNIDSFLFEKTKKRYLFLFDWDDTLFPSTFFNNHGYYSVNKLPKKIQYKIKLLENIILDIFRNIIPFGELVIITNSDKKWVKLTCKLFMPLLNLFMEKNVLRISAKNVYDAKYPGEPIMWKAKVMKHILKKFYGEHKNRYVVSVGDSIIENTAIRTVSRLLDIDTITVIKFIEAPTINQLRSQLIQFKDYVYTIHKHINDVRTVIIKK